MPVTKEEDGMILAYAKAGFTPERIINTMHNLGHNIPKSTIYKHIARMCRPNGKHTNVQTIQVIRRYLLSKSNCECTGSGPAKTVRTAENIETVQRLIKSPQAPGYVRSHLSIAY